MNATSANTTNQQNLIVEEIKNRVLEIDALRHGNKHPDNIELPLDYIEALDEITILERQEIEEIARSVIAKHKNIVRTPAPKKKPKTKERGINEWLINISGVLIVVVVVKVAFVEDEEPRDLNEPSLFTRIAKVDYAGIKDSIVDGAESAYTTVAELIPEATPEPHATAAEEAQLASTADTPEQNLEFEYQDARELTTNQNDNEQVNVIAAQSNSVANKAQAVSETQTLNEAAASEPTPEPVRLTELASTAQSAVEADENNKPDTEIKDTEPAIAELETVVVPVAETLIAEASANHTAAEVSDNQIEAQQETQTLLAEAATIENKVDSANNLTNSVTGSNDTKPVATELLATESAAELASTTAKATLSEDTSIEVTAEGTQITDKQLDNTLLANDYLITDATIPQSADEAPTAKVEAIQASATGVDTENLELATELVTTELATTEPATPEKLIPEQATELVAANESNVPETSVESHINQQTAADVESEQDQVVAKATTQSIKEVSTQAPRAQVKEPGFFDKLVIAFNDFMADDEPASPQLAATNKQASTASKSNNPADTQLNDVQVHLDKPNTLAEVNDVSVASDVSKVVNNGGNAAAIASEHTVNSQEPDTSSEVIQIAITEQDNVDDITQNAIAMAQPPQLDDDAQQVADLNADSKVAKESPSLDMQPVEATVSNEPVVLADAAEIVDSEEIVNSTEAISTQESVAQTTQTDMQTDVVKELATDELVANNNQVELINVDETEISTQATQPAEKQSNIAVAEQSVKQEEQLVTAASTNINPVEVDAQATPESMDSNDTQDQLALASQTPSETVGASAVANPIDEPALVTAAEVTGQALEETSTNTVVDTQTIQAEVVDTQDVVDTQIADIEANVGTEVETSVAENTETLVAQAPETDESANQTSDEVLVDNTQVTTEDASQLAPISTAPVAFEEPVTQIIANAENGTEQQPDAIDNLLAIETAATNANPQIAAIPEVNPNAIDMTEQLDAIVDMAELAKMSVSEFYLFKNRLPKPADKIVLPVNYFKAHPMVDSIYLSERSHLVVELADDFGSQKQITFVPNVSGNTSLIDWECDTNISSDMIAEPQGASCTISTANAANADSSAGTALK
ncbi:hypothetical protein EXU30_15025 [Shewanella maritima]|uniref:Uncharacterized protein n=1 Tax=Shewanella maritima TaxID=2520507 RepID=A0A411PK25_9GAMM|nr:hypothetical protein [Shewanella maritima]QBF83844.1 hypothetical protein EXU30_15025 [Shewanella maritima]